MKIDAKIQWSDTDMASFTHLKNKEDIVIIDLDYVDDVSELISALADEIYRKFDVILTSEKAVRNVVTNMDELEGEICQS